MISSGMSKWGPSKWAVTTYAAIFLLALGFDLLTDRSFGALMLAVLPISLVALGCLLVGPWQQGTRNAAAAKCWFVGALLVLLISIAFALLGTVQAKTGELLFSYAILILAFPASLLLPVAAMLIEPMATGSVFLRIVTTWLLCLGLGWLEWKALCWLYANIRQRIRGA